MSKIADTEILCVSARPFTTKPFRVVSQMPANENNHRFNVVLKGLSHIDDGTAQYTAGPGDVIYFPPRFARTEWNDVEQPLHCIVLLFKWPDAPTDLPRLTRDGGRIRQLAAWLCEDMIVRPRSWRTALGLMTAVISEYMTLQDIAVRGPDDQLVAAARRHVLDRLDAPPSLDELATLLGIDKFSLIRRYRASVGLTPMQDARQIRLDQGRMLLLTTNSTVAEIARHVGFHCPFHFSRAYAAHFGHPPTAARKHEQ
jgi:AraC-like DNA-binding protein